MYECGIIAYFYCHRYLGMFDIDSEIGESFKYVSAAHGADLRRSQFKMLVTAFCDAFEGLRVSDETAAVVLHRAAHRIHVLFALDAYAYGGDAEHLLQHIGKPAHVAIIVTRTYHKC